MNNNVMSAETNHTKAQTPPCGLSYHLNLNLFSLEGETWKDIYAYAGMYQVSNKGRIKSITRCVSGGRILQEKILKQYFVGDKQLMVTLCADGNKNKVYVLQLVGGCFVGFTKNYEVYVHLDSNKHNNSADNIGITSKSSQLLLSYHNGVMKDWGIKNVGAKTRFVATTIYTGTDKKGCKKSYSSNDLLLKYGAGVRSVLRCIEGRKNFKTAYGQTWEKSKI
jgi:hypothetical protein